MSFKIHYRVDSMNDDYLFFTDVVEAESFDEAIAQVRSNMVLWKTKEAVVYQEVACLDSYDSTVECAKELNAPKQFSSKQLEEPYKSSIRLLQKMIDLAVGHLAHRDCICPVDVNQTVDESFEENEYDLFQRWYEHLSKKAYYEINNQKLNKIQEVAQ